MPAPNYYQTGTVTLTSGSAAFTTTGAALQTAGIRDGDIIIVKGASLLIASVTGENEGTLLDPCPAAAAGTTNLRIAFQNDTQRYHSWAVWLRDKLSNGVLTGLADVTGAADKLTYLTGPAAWATIDFKAWARGFLGAADHAGGRAALGVREMLAAPRTYYVRPNGSNSNNGLTNTAGGAFATPQRAIDVAFTLDSGLSDVEIVLAPGTYPGVIVSGQMIGRGRLIMRGSGAAASEVVISAPSANAVLLDNNARLELSNLTLTAASNGVNCNGGSRLSFAGVDFGACGSAHIYAIMSEVVAAGNYRIVGDAAYHIVAQTRSIVTISYRAITIPSPRAFSGSFIFATTQGVVHSYAATFSGSATGSRYYVGVAAIIYTGGGGPSHFPGSSVGSIDPTTFGLYV